jgi:hypothetical protein
VQVPIYVVYYLLHNRCDDFAPPGALEPRAGQGCYRRGGNLPFREGMTNDSAPTATYYRNVAREIRAYAQQVQLWEVQRDLLDLAERFDRMALYVEKRYPNGRRGSRPQGSSK